MKKIKEIHGLLKRMAAVIFLYFLQWSHILAQLPTNYPNPESKPLDLTLKNILLYFVSPVLLVIVYFLVRRYKRKQAGQNEKERKEQ